jgi:hypothetical protein
MAISKQHSFVAPRNVRPMDYSKIGMDGLGLVGIGIDANTAVKMMSAMDALEPTVTTGSISTPTQFLQAWMPGFVKVVTAARQIDELVGIQTIGSWEDEEIVQATLEVTGSAAPYTGLSTGNYGGWNQNFERRTVVRFKNGMQVDTLEEARASKVRMGAADNKRQGSALALEISRNRVGFFGYNSGDNRTYGFLNDPSISAYADVAAGAATTKEWSTKTFLEITADIREAVKTLRVQSGNLIDASRVQTTLAVATAAVDYLAVTSDFGISVYDWIQKTYSGKMRILSAPELDGANGGENVFYLYAESFADGSTDGGAVFAQMVPLKFQVLGVQKLDDGYREAYTNATAGVLCKRPWAVVRRSNI